MEAGFSCGSFKDLHLGPTDSGGGEVQGGTSSESSASFPNSNVRPEELFEQGLGPLTASTGLR
jgi:hypothetical protein